MSQDFRFKFDRMRENDPTGQNDGNKENPGNTERYESAGHSRNLGLRWTDNRQMFLNYSYLISVEYLPHENMITLAFTTHSVALTGIRLQKLYEELMDHLPRIISCTEARYNSLLTADQFAVNEIRIEKL